MREGNVGAFPSRAALLPRSRMDAAPRRAAYLFNVYEPFLLNLILDDRKRIKKSRIDGGSGLCRTPKVESVAVRRSPRPRRKRAPEQYRLAPRSPLTLFLLDLLLLPPPLTRGLVSVGLG